MRTRALILLCVVPLACAAPEDQPPVFQSVSAPFSTVVVDELTGSGTAYNDWFGNALAVSGDYMVVGRPLDDTGFVVDHGSAFIFERQANGIWAEQQLLLPQAQIIEGYFGRAVAIDGDTAVVGAWGEGNNKSGAAYIYVRNAGSGVWQLEQRITPNDGNQLDYFGYDVAISGDIAVVGAINDDDDGGNAGSAYVFTRSGGQWTQAARLAHPSPTANKYAGRAVAVDGNVIAMGAPRGAGSAPLPGDVAIFETANGGASWTSTTTLTPPISTNNDRFGQALALDGDTLVVGAPGFGVAHVFERQSSGQWMHDSTLTTSMPQSSFGSAVAIRGNIAMVGDPLKDVGATDTGAAYVFHQNNGAWSYVESINATNVSADARLGTSLAVEGRSVFAGAERSDTAVNNGGSVYIATFGGDLGDGCTANLDCLSGMCVDGVCCDTACSGDCEACNISGDEGTCSPIAAMTECRAPAGECDVAEVCDGQSGQCPIDMLAIDGTTCFGGTCQAGMCMPDGMGGSGAGGSTGGAGGSNGGSGNGGATSGGQSSGGSSQGAGGGQGGTGAAGQGGGASPGDDGGCSIGGTGSSTSSPSSWAALALGLSLARRRRRLR